MNPIISKQGLNVVAIGALLQAHESNIWETTNARNVIQPCLSKVIIE